MNRLYQHRPWVASGVAVTLVSVGLHYLTGPAFGNAWLLGALSALIAFSLVVMGLSTEVWTARSLGLGWILTGVAIRFGALSLGMVDLGNPATDWPMSIARGCLWVGAVLFGVGVVQWIRDPLRNEGPYERGVTEGTRRERLR